MTNHSSGAAKSRATSREAAPAGQGDERVIERLVDSCLTFGKYQPHELLHWLVDDVLADFGVAKEQPPPPDVLPWLRAVAEHYANIAQCNPFRDVLGYVYPAIGSRGRRRSLGLFFTPQTVSAAIASMLAVGIERPADGRLLRVCEPACGSGALLLAFVQAQVTAGGGGAMRNWSISAIDLDVLCTRMCAAQVLANAYVHRIDLGELIVYRGNALGPRAGLSVVVHTTVAELTPDLVLPALHPSRVDALQSAVRARSAEQTTNAAEVSGDEKGARSPAAAGADGLRASAAKVDLFADC